MNHPSSEFDDAVAAACHGTADDARLEELGRLLAENDAALEDYLARAELHAMLLTSTEFMPAVLGDAMAPRRPAGAVPSAVPPAGLGAWRAVVAFAVVFAIVEAAWFVATKRLVRPEVARIAATPDDAGPETIGVVDDFWSVVWMGADTIVESGNPLRAGDRLELAAGSLRIDFSSGASVRLAGPAIFTAESPLSAQLVMGRAHVTATTPESKGFTIHTRTGRIVDLGTEFTAEALADGRCRVGVTSGEVRFELAHSDVSHLLRAGGVMDVSPGRRQVVTRIERGDDSAAFTFPSIEPPSADDLADASRGRASIRCVRGLLYENPARQITSAAPEILLDGKGQSGPDAPSESLYFADGEEGGLVLDLGAEVAVTRINVYSWHRCLNPGFPAALREAHRERAAQNYALYGRAADPPDGAGDDPAAAGWTFIARVNSDEYFGLTGSDRPAQQASSVSAARGPLGRFRHLLFVIQPTPGLNHDGRLLEFGTFCGEIDVYGE